MAQKQKLIDKGTRKPIPKSTGNPIKRVITQSPSRQRSLITAKKDKNPRKKTIIVSAKNIFDFGKN